MNVASTEIQQLRDSVSALEEVQKSKTKKAISSFSTFGGKVHGDIDGNRVTPDLQFKWKTKG